MSKTNPTFDNLDNVTGKLNSREKSTLDLGGKKVLCRHCLRTSENGIKCMGMCVEESGY